MNSQTQLINRTTAIGTLMATLLATGAFSASAYASEQKAYTGSNCDVPNQTQAANLSKTDQGTAFNTSASAPINYLVCPVIREKVNIQSTRT